MDLYADAAVQGMPDGIFEGRDAIYERLSRELEAIPDVTHTVVSFIEQGDAFADEWTFVGTQTGPFLLPNGTVLPPSGKRVEVQGMEVVRVRPDGKIVLNTLYYDNLAVANQLGLVPEGAVA
jgi:predicted ester cyclase